MRHHFQVVTLIFLMNSKDLFFSKLLISIIDFVFKLLAGLLNFSNRLYCPFEIFEVLRFILRFLNYLQMTHVRSVRVKHGPSRYRILSDILLEILVQCDLLSNWTIARDRIKVPHILLRSAISNPSRKNFVVDPGHLILDFSKCFWVSENSPVLSNLLRLEQHEGFITPKRINPQAIVTFYYQMPSRKDTCLVSLFSLRFHQF